MRQEVGRLKEAGAIKGNLLPGMARKYRGAQEEERQMKSLCRFHGFELSVPKGPIPYAKDRSIGRCHLWEPEDEFSRRLSGLSSDRPSCRGLGEDGIHLPSCELPLHHDAFWVEECLGDIPTNDDYNVFGTRLGIRSLTTSW